MLKRFQVALLVAQLVALFLTFGVAFSKRAAASPTFIVREAGIVKCDGDRFCPNSGPPDNVDGSWQVRGYDSKRDLLIMEKEQ